MLDLIVWFARQSKNVAWCGMLIALCLGRAEKTRSHRPTLAIFSENGHGFFVAPDDDAYDGAAHVWLKGDAVTDTETKHRCVCACMLHKT